MEYRVGINGFGRIGRNYVRCLLERGLLERGIRLAGINDLWDPGTWAHLLQNDTTFGNLRWDVDHDDANLRVGGQNIPTFRENDPANLRCDLDIDLVIEATGRLRARDDAAAHLKVGARQVLLSAPGKNADATVVVGVNENSYDPARHEILSAASCTTNCVAPMVKVLHESFGLVRGLPHHRACLHQ